MNGLRCLDLFSGIGGFALGLERAAIETVAFCERDRYARQVLAKHWPQVPCYENIITLTKRQLKRDGLLPIDIIAGGFPCQDVSIARGGHVAQGIHGAKSSLWWEMLRLIEEVRPSWVVIENVPALRMRGADEVFSGLETLHYTVWPCVVGAIHAGASHRRQRVWVLAHAARNHEGSKYESWNCWGAGCLRSALPRKTWPADPAERSGPQSRVGRLAHGVPHRMDRLRCLGNAVVPDIAEIFGTFIREAHGRLQVGD